MRRRGSPEDAPSRASMVKTIDSWWTVVAVDPIAVPLTRALIRWPRVTPVKVSVVAHVLGVVAAACFATGNLVAGAVVFEVRFVLDCVDGKLARATGRASGLGRELDVRGDQLITLVVIVALGLHADFVATAVLAGLHPLFMLFLDARNRLSAASPGTSDTDTVSGGGAGGRWRAAMARRRCYPVPTSVDVEHLALFIAPALVGVADVVVPALWLATAWFALQVLRYLVEILRTAHRQDRLDTSPGTAPGEPTPGDGS